MASTQAGQGRPGSGPGPRGGRGHAPLCRPPCSELCSSGKAPVRRRPHLTALPSCPFGAAGGAHRGQNTLTQTRPSKLCASSLRDPGSPYKSATGGNTGAPRPRPLPFLHTGGCWYYTWFFSRCLCNLTRRRACSLDATAASQLRPGGVGTSAFLAPGTRSPRLTPRWALEGKQSVQPTRHLLPTVCVRARFGYRLVRIWIPPTRRPAGAGGCSAAGPRAGAHPPALGGPDIPVPPASEGNPNAPDPWRRAETLLGLHQGHKIMPEFS